EHTLITIGDISNPTVLITFVGLIITILLFIKNVPGNLLLSIGVTTLLTICLGETPVEGISLSMPNISEYLHVFGQISWNQTGNIVFWLTSISFAMVIVFENIGLIHGHCKMLRSEERRVGKE